MAAVEEGCVVGCHAKEDFDKQRKIAVDSGKLLVIDFTASWCGPCRFISPIFVDIAKKMPQVMFLKIDVDELKDVAEEFKVEAMPTFVFLKVEGGELKEVDRVVGAKKDELQACISKHSAASAAASANASV